MLFVLGLIGFFGLLAMAIDVGRVVWARTQIQAAVDAAALAAAQSMPDQTGASQQAGIYWTDNSGFIRSQGQNVAMTVSFPGGNKAVAIHAEADLSTWFARFFGLDSWHVTADGQGESQVLDIALVLDVSESMCDGSYPVIDQRWHMSPGRTASVPRLAGPIDATQTTINVVSAAPFTAPAASYFGGSGYWAGNGGTPYWQAGAQKTIGGVLYKTRTGMIMIDNELMQITGVSGNVLTVTRGQPDKQTSTDSTFAGIPTAKTAHAANSEVWLNRDGCSAAGRAANGPYEPYDSLVADAQAFTGLFSGFDKMGLVSFSSSAAIKDQLNSNLNAIRSDLANALPKPPSGGTNSAHGIAVARQVLDGSGKRSNALRVMVFETDGRAKEWCGSASYSASAYDTTSCSVGGGIEGNATAVSHVMAEAQRAAADGIIIYVIGLGPDVDNAFLQQLATVGRGKYYAAPTSAELVAAFQAIAAETHIALTK